MSEKKKKKPKSPFEYSSGSALRGDVMFDSEAELSPLEKEMVNAEPHDNAPTNVNELEVPEETQVHIRMGYVLDRILDEEFFFGNNAFPLLEVSIYDDRAGKMIRKFTISNCSTMALVDPSTKQQRNRKVWTREGKIETRHWVQAKCTHIPGEYRILHVEDRRTNQAYISIEKHPLARITRSIAYERLFENTYIGFSEARDNVRQLVFALGFGTDPYNQDDPLTKPPGYIDRKDRLWVKG